MALISGATVFVLTPTNIPEYENASDLASIDQQTALQLQTAAAQDTGALYYYTTNLASTTSTSISSTDELGVWNIATQSASSSDYLPALVLNPDNTLSSFNFSVSSLPLSSNNIVIGDATGSGISATVGGALTVSYNTGTGAAVFVLADDSVSNDNIEDDTISVTKMITPPAYVISYIKSQTQVLSGNTMVITDATILSTDEITCTTIGASANPVATYTVSAGSISVQFQNTSTDSTTVQYVGMRAAS